MHPGRRFPLLSEPKIDRRGKRSAEKDVARVCVCGLYSSFLFYFFFGLASLACDILISIPIMSDGKKLSTIILCL